MHLRPIRFDSVAQRRQAVARDPLGANPLFPLRLVISVADPLPGFGPILFDHAVNQQAVHIIGVEHFAVKVDLLENVLRLVIDLGLDKELLPRQALDGIGNPVKRRVLLRAVKVSDAPIVGVANEAVEALLPQRALNVPVVAAGAKTHAAQPDARVAQRDLIHRSSLNRRVRAQ